MALRDNHIARPILLKPTLSIFLLLAGLCVFALKLPTALAGNGRFFFSGDGRIHLTSEKSGSTFRGSYRNDTGGYDSDALRQISLVFGAPYSSGRMEVSMRLIEFLDYLEDRHRQGAPITITSGYRNPKYNTNLRKQGRLAAKASLHQYGMAADLTMQDVPSRRIWEDVKALGFGGTGYYQGRTVHIDVGPARSWDQSSSGVGTGISDDNKLIGLVTDYDYYHPGQQILLRFIRMTAFPIGVNPEFYLVSVSQGDTSPLSFTPVFAGGATAKCPAFESIDQMNAIAWHLPKKITSGRYRIRARFCNNTYPDMPAEVSTPEFEVVQ